MGLPQNWATKANFSMLSNSPICFVTSLHVHGIPISLTALQHKAFGETFGPSFTIKSWHPTKTPSPERFPQSSCWAKAWFLPPISKIPAAATIASFKFKKWAAEVAMILKYFWMRQCRNLKILCRFISTWVILFSLSSCSHLQKLSLTRWNGRLLKEKCGAILWL